MVRGSKLRKHLLLVGMLSLSGCATYTGETREIRQSYQNHSFDNALAKLEASGMKDQERNRLLYLLEKAMILDRQGQRGPSRALFLEADKLVDSLYTESVSKTAASFLYNDSATDYAGEDYEKVAIHLQLALSYLEDNDLSAAGVEARKINSRLNEINQKYEQAKNRYAEDAFARYLAGMIYEARGDIDSAIIDYTAALSTYETLYASRYQVGAPDEMIRALLRLLAKRGRKDQLTRLEQRFPKAAAIVKSEGNAAAGELIVLHETGTIAIKVAKDFVVPIGGQVVRFSWPVINRQSYSSWGTTGVEVGTRGLFRGEISQNMDAIASDTLDDRRGRMLLKAGTRLLIKGQATRKAAEEFGIIGWLAGNIYGAVTETADTRSWTLLPSAFYVTRVRLAPGNYPVTVKTNGRVSALKDVQIKAGAVSFIRAGG